MGFPVGLFFLLISVISAVPGQPVADQPPVIADFLKTENHLIQLTSER
jgi:hypothetical protein